MKFRREISAGGILFKSENGQKLWLIVQLASHNGWGFPKGHIGDTIENESSEDAALREVREEGGVTARILIHEPIKTAYSFRREGYFIKKSVYYYLMEYQSGDIADHDHEIQDIKFVPADEIRKTLTFKTDKEAFEKALLLQP